MTRPRMRPQFELSVGDRGPAVFIQLREQLEAPDAEFYGHVHRTFAFVGIPKERRSLLSPHLELELCEGKEGAVLRGRFAPQPNVWGGFMALFFFLGLVGLSGLIYGVSQLMLDGPIWMMWTAPASLALIGFIYGAAFIGQGLSTDEMFELRAFVECTVREVCGEG